MPGTRLDIRLDENDNPKPGEEPINRIDKAAFHHDLNYREAGNDLNKKHIADKIMIQELDNIQKPTVRERIERLLVGNIINAKVKLGLGMSLKQSEQLANELHKPFRKPKYLLKVKVFHKDDIWSADLVVMNEDNLGRSGKYKYILTVIDLYTRYAWAIPMKNKTALETKNAFEKVFLDSKRKPKRLWTDLGKEFVGSIMKSFLKENNIEIYSTKNEGKAVVIERFNRTLKNIMWKRFTVQGNQKWVKILPEIVDFYNNKIHRMIKTTPKNASENPDKIKEIITKHNFENENKLPKMKPKFKLGDRVRIFKYKYHFEKGYTYKWTNEIFTINEIINSSPITYRIKDLNNEEIDGKFYESELQHTKF